MPEQLYLETTIISYLTSRPSRDVIIAGHQQSTLLWWETQRTHYEICISQLVLEEAGAGDAIASQRRLKYLEAARILDFTPLAGEIANQIIEQRIMPSRVRADALHLAIAAIHEIPLLLTWNCRHLANPHVRAMVNKVCQRHGLLTPAICTPDELLGHQP